MEIADQLKVIPVKSKDETMKPVKFQIVLGLTSKQCGCVWCFHCLPRWISPQVSSKSDSGVCQCQRSRRKFGSARHSKSPHAAARLRFVSFCAKWTTRQVFIKIPEWHKFFQGLQVPSLLLLSITVTLRTWKIHVLSNPKDLWIAI